MSRDYSYESVRRTCRGKNPFPTTLLIVIGSIFAVLILATIIVAVFVRGRSDETDSPILGDLVDQGARSSPDDKTHVGKNGLGSVSSSKQARNTEKDLENLGVLYGAYCLRNGRRTPARIGDLAGLAHEQAELLPAYLALQAGQYVVRWGIQPLDNDGKILAYEKDALTKGGYVLVDMGVVRRFTAQEINLIISQERKP